MIIDEIIENIRNLLFEEGNQESMKKEKDRILEVSTEYLVPFQDHPFKVQDNEDMEKLKESIREHGLISPIVVRIRPGTETLEIISGHRRCEACKALGMEKVPVIIRDLTDDQAIISMVDANLQRETILPSEKAFAYKMKMEALSRQGQRSDLTSAQVEPKLTAEAISETDSAAQVKRYVRLTYLNPEILKMVDDKKIAFNVGVQLSFLPEDKQLVLLDAMNCEDRTPSLAQANALKKQFESGVLEDKDIFDLLKQQKSNEKEFVKIPTDMLIGKYFKKGTTVDFMSEIIMEALNFYAEYKLEQQRNAQKGENNKTLREQEKQQPERERKAREELEKIMKQEAERAEKAQVKSSDLER